MLKVIIVNEEVNLSVEKGKNENALKFTIFKDSVTSETLSVEVDRNELGRVISFVMGDDLPLEPIPTPEIPDLPMPTIPDLPLPPIITDDPIIHFPNL